MILPPPPFIQSIHLRFVYKKGLTGLELGLAPSTVNPPPSYAHGGDNAGRGGGKKKTTDKRRDGPGHVFKHLGYNHIFLES